MSELMIWTCKPNLPLVQKTSFYMGEFLSRKFVLVGSPPLPMFYTDFQQKHHNARRVRTQAFLSNKCDEARLRRILEVRRFVRTWRRSWQLCSTAGFGIFRSAQWCRKLGRKFSKLLEWRALSQLKTGAILIEILLLSVLSTVNYKFLSTTVLKIFLRLIYQ